MPSLYIEEVANRRRERHKARALYKKPQHSLMLLRRSNEYRHRVTPARCRKREKPPAAKEEAAQTAPLELVVRGAVVLRDGLNEYLKVRLLLQGDLETETKAVPLRTGHLR